MYFSFLNIFYNKFQSHLSLIYRDQYPMLIINIMSLTYNKKVLEQLRETKRTSPNTSSITLDYMQIGNLQNYLQFLSEFKNLQKLSLHNNGLKVLPKDLSTFGRLVQLDISNNIFLDIDSVVSSLRTLPSLQRLKISVKGSQHKTIIQNLPMLIELNEKKVIRISKRQQFKLNTLNHSNFQNYSQKLIKQFKKLLQLEDIYINSGEEKDHQSQISFFKDDLANIINDTLKKAEKVQDDMTQSLEQILFFNTKYDMYHHLKTRSLLVCTNIYGDIGMLLKIILDQQTQLFKSLLERSYKICQAQIGYKQYEREIKSQLSSDPQQVFYRRMLFLQKQLKRKKNSLIDLQNENQQLQKMNNKYMDKIVQLSQQVTIDETINKAIVSISSPPKKQKATHHRGLSEITNSINSAHKIYKKSHNQSIATVNNHNRSLNLSKSPIRSDRISKRNHRESLGSTHIANNNKSLTLKHLKENIQEIYEAKVRYDHINIKKKLPQQTMYQYLYTHLNQKYGLKSLIIQSANSIVTSIKAYSKVDNDIAVFEKILKNQIDEQFHFIQAELKTVILKKLKTLFVAKNPHKNLNQLSNGYTGQINLQITLEQSESIINDLYNRDDARNIMNELTLIQKKYSKPNTQVKIIKSRRASKQENLIKQRAKKSILFHQFIQCVLNYQLKIHQQFLKPLVRVFKKIDHNSTGILNQEQFKTLIQKLCEESSFLIPELLQIVDPYSTKSITFSQIVKVLQKNPSSNPILSRFIQQNQLLNKFQFQNT